MPFLELFDETLDINSTDNYESAIEVSKYCFTFCLLDTLRNKIVLLRSYQPDEGRTFDIQQIEELVGNDDFITKHFKKTRIITPSWRSTLIPDPLFISEKKDEYFAFNHIVNESDIILENLIPEINSHLLFSCSDHFKKLINRFFPESVHFHQLKPLLRHISSSKNIPNYIHLHIENDFINLLVFDGQTLRFCNSFNYKTTSDILYFAMNVFKKLDIKQEGPINISGLTYKYDSLYSMLSGYIGSIKYSEPIGSYTFSYVFNDIELHRYLILFSALNCE